MAQAQVLWDSWIPCTASSRPYLLTNCGPFLCAVSPGGLPLLSVHAGVWGGGGGPRCPREGVFALGGGVHKSANPQGAGADITFQKGVKSSTLGVIEEGAL